MSKKIKKIVKIMQKYLQLYKKSSIITYWIRNKIERNGREARPIRIYEDFSTKVFFTF